MLFNFTAHCRVFYAANSLTAFRMNLFPLVIVIQLFNKLINADFEKGKTYLCIFNEMTSYTCFVVDLYCASRRGKCMEMIAGACIEAHSLFGAKWLSSEKDLRDSFCLRAVGQ